MQFTTETCELTSATRKRAEKEYVYRSELCKRGSKESKGLYTIKLMENLLVIDDSQFCGGTKSRFAHLLPKHFKEYVYATNGLGGLPLALAVILQKRKFNSKIVLFINKKYKLFYFISPLLRVAKEQNVHIDEYFVDDSGSEAEKYVDEDPRNRFLVPNGLDLPQMKEQLAILGTQIARKIGSGDVCFLPCGSGTLSRGLSNSKNPCLAKRYISICVAGGPSPVGNAKLIVYPADVCIPTPMKDMPSGYHTSLFYDSKIYKYAYKYAVSNPRDSVYIWNVL